MSWNYNLLIRITVLAKYACALLLNLNYNNMVLWIIGCYIDYEYFCTVATCSIWRIYIKLAVCCTLIVLTWNSPFFLDRNFVPSLNFRVKTVREQTLSVALWLVGGFRAIGCGIHVAYVLFPWFSQGCNFLLYLPAKSPASSLNLTSVLDFPFF
jgi:hypothetical protein